MAVSTSLGLVGRFLGNAVSETFAFAAGVALGPVLGPPVQEIRNEVNAQYPFVPVEPGDAAEIVAEDVEQTSWGRQEAAYHGVDQGRFDALVGAVLNAPGVGELFQARRRNLISQQQFIHGLRKARLETLWDDSMTGLLDAILSVADLANAVVQGHMDLPEATAVAAKWGYSAADFGVLVENTGLPPGPSTLIDWRRRGFIDDAQLDQGIREGHTKTKYVPFFHDALAAQLTASQITGLRVKGWITAAQSYTLGAAHGYTAEQMDQMWQEAGRPATPHQIHIGYARGASVPGAANEREAIDQSVQRSDLQTRYSDVIYAGRYTYPPFFATRTLAQAEVITKAEMEQILLFEGWEPTLADKVATFYTTPTGTAAKTDPYIGKAETQLWTELHKAYVKQGNTRAQVEPYLTVLIPTAATRETVFTLWTDEKTMAATAPPAA